MKLGRHTYRLPEYEVITSTNRVPVQLLTPIEIK